MRKKTNKQTNKQKATGKLKLKHICMKTVSSYITEKRLKRGRQNVSRIGNQ